MTPQENRHVRRGNFSLSVKQLIEKALHGGAVFLQVICLLRHKTYFLLLLPGCFAGEIGGNMGLFLGLSFLTVCEFVHFVIYICHIRHEKKA